MLGTQNSKERRLPGTHTHHAHKTIVDVKCRSRMCHRSSEPGALGNIPKGEITESW